MHCPGCGFDNLTGADVCDNCGTELAGNDTPQPTISFHGRLLGEHLDELKAGPPLTVGPDTPADVGIARMQDAEPDCVLVAQTERPVGLPRARRPRRQVKHARPTGHPRGPSVGGVSIAGRPASV